MDAAALVANARQWRARIAAIAPKTGGGPSVISRSQTIQATMVARAVLATCRSGSRAEARTAAVRRMASP